MKLKLFGRQNNSCTQVQIEMPQPFIFHKLHGQMILGI